MTLLAREAARGRCLWAHVVTRRRLMRPRCRLLADGAQRYDSRPAPSACARLGSSGRRTRLRAAAYMTKNSRTFPGPCWSYLATSCTPLLLQAVSSSDATVTYCRCRCCSWSSNAVPSWRTGCCRPACGLEVVKGRINIQRAGVVVAVMAHACWLAWRYQSKDQPERRKVKVVEKRGGGERRLHAGEQIDPALG